MNPFPDDIEELEGPFEQTPGATNNGADDSSSSSCILEFEEYYVTAPWDESTYDATTNLVTNCSPIDWSLSAQYATISTSGIITFGSKGELMYVTATYNPAITASILVHKVEVTTASIDNGKFVVNLGPEAVPGMLSIYFKKDTKQVLVYQKDNIGGGDITVELDDCIEKLKPHNKEKYTHVYATWTVNGITSKSADKQLDHSITVLSSWTLTNFFTPDWDGKWDGSAIEVGIYPSGNFPAGLYKQNVQSSLLNSLREKNEGLALSGNTVIRFREQTVQNGFPPFKGKFYIEFPDREQQTAGCSSAGHMLRSTSIAVTKTCKDLKCGDKVYVPEFKVRTVDDHGKLSGNNTQVDVWIGKGGQETKTKADSYGKKTGKTLLLLDR